MRVEPLKVANKTYYTAYEGNYKAIGRTRAEAIHRVVLEVIRPSIGILRNAKSTRMSEDIKFKIPYNREPQQKKKVNKKRLCPCGNKTMSWTPEGEYCSFTCLRKYS